jgi:hypothetical protein
VGNPTTRLSPILLYLPTSAPIISVSTLYLLSFIYLLSPCLLGGHLFNILISSAIDEYYCYPYITCKYCSLIFINFSWSVSTFRNVLISDVADSLASQKRTLQKLLSTSCPCFCSTHQNMASNTFNFSKTSQFEIKPDVSNSLLKYPDSIYLEFQGY